MKVLSMNLNNQLTFMIFKVVPDKNVCTSEIEYIFFNIYTFHNMILIILLHNDCIKDVDYIVALV